MRRGALAAFAGACSLLGSSGAQAHFVDTGLGPILDGASHFLVSFDDLLPVVAFALLAGLGGAGAAKRALVALPAAWLASGAAGFAAGKAFLPAGTTSVSLLVLGILVAANRRLSPAIATALATAIGLLHGWLNGAAIAVAGREALALAGIVAAVIAVSALLAVPATRLDGPGARIAIRVAGSWIAAIGLLYLGWTLSGRL